MPAWTFATERDYWMCTCGSSGFFSLENDREWSHSTLFHTSLIMTSSIMLSLQYLMPIVVGYWNFIAIRTCVSAICPIEHKYSHMNENRNFFSIYSSTKHDNTTNVTPTILSAITCFVSFSQLQSPKCAAIPQTLRMCQLWIPSSSASEYLSLKVCLPQHLPAHPGHQVWLPS